jgi:hypothetical protein
MNKASEIEAFFDEVAALTERIGPHLADCSPAVQSAALADCLARLLAGHVCAGDPEGTDELREGLLASVVRMVRELIEPRARGLGTWL